MEKWEEVEKGLIPIGNYEVMISNGEKFGLHVNLKSNTHNVKINFGIVSAVRMMDEGVILEGIFDENEILKYKANKFSNMIYKIYNGQFGDFMKKTSNELYEYLGLQHYIIITMNYIIEIISQWEPDIEVNNLK